MSDDAPHDPHPAAEAIRLGRQGLGRREIASRLGLSFAELNGRAESVPDFARALERAEDEARAWWEALPREAMANGARFNLNAWRDAVRARFGGGMLGEPEPEPPRPRVIFDYPDNGMGGYRPNATDEDDWDDEAADDGGDDAWNDDDNGEQPDEETV